MSVTFQASQGVMVHMVVVHGPATTYYKKFVYVFYASKNQPTYTEIHCLLAKPGNSGEMCVLVADSS